MCGTAVYEGYLYCEKCGHTLGAPTCASCGAAAVDAEGYCERCGLRQPTGRDHAETVLDDGPAAAVTDKGLRRSRNEDAVALLSLGRTVVGVVCDGVGSSPRADEASSVAVEAAGAALIRGLPHEEAFELAGRAVSKLATSVHDAPACTYLAAVVRDGRASLAWAGDTRAYWLPAPPPTAATPIVPELLTTDDAIETGEITAWLGADAEDVPLHVRDFAPAAPGLLLLCSDGLWRYLDGCTLPGPGGPEQTGEPLELARELLRHALDSGGQDNITIALIPLGDARE
ncbi:protein phosphatase 2C domain-containing protein [Actinomadura sp. ATCC 31491]|uniref:Protein phosphatase 2C domain-containing protein n=1 Tax=Actinomadura luzonensis TaxID=2805427 RepID=A0ABT0G733_9ACTN|nr:protein phosphatase 2C domain-containing protein [Actinomadura luzonensis]MCK2220035.1 protein phosphatase 2C domain-containing protein [Actinomadura luzonensis]